METLTQYGRMMQEAHRESPVLGNPGRIADVLREPNRLYAVEHFQVLCLNTRRRLIAVENIGRSILDQVLVHARDVFAVAIALRASAIVLAHTHPGGEHQQVLLWARGSPGAGRIEGGQGASSHLQISLDVAVCRFGAP